MNADMPKNKTLKILHIDAEPSWSGGETQVMALMEHLRQWGHTNIIACPGHSSIAEKCRQRNFETHAVRMRNSLDLPSIIRLAGILRNLDPDVVHMHTSRAHFLGTLAAMLAKPRAILIVTRRMDYRIKRAMLIRHLYSRMDKVVAISSGVRRALEASGIASENIATIPSGVNLEKFIRSGQNSVLRNNLSIPMDAKVLGVMASLVERKGHRFLLLAMADILAKIPNTYLLIVGDGPSRPALEQLSSQLGIDQQVIFTGWQKNNVEILAALDLLVLPSLAEGLGVTILEGMAMSLPVIGTTEGGIPDAVQDGVSGFLVPPKDAATMGQRILAILQDSELAAKMGAAGRKLVEEKFSAEVMAKQNETLYFKIINGRNKGR